MAESSARSELMDSVTSPKSNVLLSLAPKIPINLDFK